MSMSSAMSAAVPAEEIVLIETKLEKAERIRLESRKEAMRTKTNETSQALKEGKKLIKKDIYGDVFIKQPHRAGRIFKSGNSPLPIKSINKKLETK